MVDSGEIKARTKWKQVYPLFSTDVRYLDMLGIPGSNPLELFWDVVDDLDQRLDAKIALVESAIRKYNQSQKVSGDGSEEAKEKEKEGDGKGFKVEPETREEDFLSVVKADQDDAVQALREEDLHEVFETVRLFPP